MTTPSDVHVNSIISKPFTGISDPKLPSNVKDRPASVRRRWVGIWNRTFNSARGDGLSVSDAESKAFQVANGSIKKELQKAGMPINELGMDSFETLMGAPYDPDFLKFRQDEEAMASGKVCGSCRFFLRASFSQVGRCQLFEAHVEVPWWWTSKAYISAEEEAVAVYRENSMEDISMAIHSPDKKDPKKKSKHPKKLKKEETSIFLAFVKADHEKRIVSGPVLVPDVEDSQGDIVSKEDVEEAAFRFMRKSQEIQRQHNSEETTVKVVESYIVPEDFKIDDELITKGTWMMSVYVPEDREDIWQAVKSGDLTGFSIRGLGRREEID